MSHPTNIPEKSTSETVSDSFLDPKEKFHFQLQDIFQHTMRLTGPDQFDQLCQWMEYKQYLTFDDFYDNSYKDPEKFDTKGPTTEYKVKGKMNHLSPNVAQKLKSFVRWMTYQERPYELHDSFLATLTRDSYLKFRHLDTQPLPISTPPHHDPQQNMSSFPIDLKPPPNPESKIALNNFKKGTKRDASVYPIFKNDKYYDTFQRSFLAHLKAQGLYDVADPKYDPESGDIYDQELFQGKQSFVYSVLVASLQTEKGRELVKEFEGDARSIILKLHHYHTKSNVAKHDIITLTTDITNLTLNDSWKGTVRQFLSHFKEKLRLLDSLVPVSDQLPETTRITFLQRAVQQNQDLRQIHVMDCVWRFKTDPTETLTFETYYNLLWDAAHQYDLHHTKKGPQRKAFISQQEEVNDENEYVIEENEFFTDPEPEEEPSPYSVYQSSFHPKMPQKAYLPPKIWETLSESTKQMIIEHNKKIKLNNPTSYNSGNKTKPNPTMGKPNPVPQKVHQHSKDDAKEELPSDNSTQTLVNKCLAESGIDPTDIQNVMSVSHAKRNISSHDSSRKIHIHQRYVFTRVNQSNHHLIDRGANGGLAGADMRVIHTTPRKINIVGIDDHELTGLNVVTAAALLDTQKGPIIGIFHEYAHLGKGKSIHASSQLEWFNCQVDDRSKIVGGAQRIETPEGYVIPFSIETGLVYMHPIRIPTDQDLQMYPHVFFTSPDIWDPSVLDHEITPSLLEDINQQSDDSLLQDSIFDEYGDLHHRATQTLNVFCDLPPLPSGEHTTSAHLHDSNPAEEDWKSLRPYFGWQSEQVIKDTYKVTSRFGGTIPRHDYLKKHFKSRNPVFNIPRRNEPVATDTIFSDTPAINDGSTMAQFFVGKDTLVCDAYGIKSQKQFINTLYDNIRSRGAMTTLITDGGRYEVSKKVADLLRSLFIKQYESEPYHQHQNKAEQRYGVVKRYINTLMNLTGAPAHCWLPCLLYVCSLLNATASPALGGLTPLQTLTGQVPDISQFLHFSFWEPVYYKLDENEPRATISEHVKDLSQDQISREDQLRFKLKIDGDQLDDLISYNQLMEYLEDKTDPGPLEDGLYRFKSIKDHKGPYTASDPEYNGSSYNILIEWETGEHTWEPLSNIIATDPYTCAVYAKEHDLLNTPGWKLLKRHARTARRLIRTLKKSKYRQAKATRKYKHGWEVPRDYAHALQLDIQNGNNKWKDAIDLEIEQIKEYQVFKDYGKAVYNKNKITNAPDEHQKIRVHFVFDVKHCGKFKARLVADGHLTKEPMETVYSGVVSIRNLRLAMFLAELNGLELWGADVGNAYLQALTREKLYIVGGPEFEALQGHVLVMYKALYGTRSGGACWHDKFFDILHDMGFKPSRADPDIWMKSSKDGSHYEYIAVYVDDLAICMKDPKAFCDTLKDKYKLKLKGVGPINYHLGCGYTRDEDGTLVADPRKYVEKILESYEKTFGEKPKKSKTPLVGRDHPESDTSDFCNQDQIKQYQTIVGQLIWLSGLGRFDIAVHVMTMSRFRQQPRIGHLDRLKKIVGYLANLPHGALRFRLHEPDYSNLPHKEYDWQRTVYKGAKEELPHDIPEPKGKHVTTTTYVDANLHHDQVTGKAVTACLHMVNATPSHWHTKRQATVETATFGSEFVAARIATDQIIDLRYTLMYLGVPVRSKSYMFGDNKSVVDSASIPTSTLSKKSTLASYHRVREAIAAGYIQFNWKDGKSNPADILSKHWEFANIWPLLKPLLFWKGDTNELNAKAKGSDRIPVKKSV